VGIDERSSNGPLGVATRRAALLWVTSPVGLDGGEDVGAQSSELGVGDAVLVVD
jgi:hypothetical protein